MGFDPAALWDLTAREVHAVMAGARQRVEREHNERAWLAWTTATLSRQKRMTPLRQLQVKSSGRGKTGRRKRQDWQTHEQLLADW